MSKVWMRKINHQKVDKLIKKAIHQVIVGPLSVGFFKQLLKYSTTAAKETGTLDAQPNT